MRVKPIPVGYHSVTPYLSIKGRDHRILPAVGVTNRFRMNTQEGAVGHAKISIMLADECAESSFRSPTWQRLEDANVGDPVDIDPITPSHFVNSADRIILIGAIL